MSNAIRLSLIVCTYGRTRELNELFRSLAVQSFQDFEVIVVDQNADDRILPCLEQARACGITLRHVRQFTPNLSLARNNGLWLARGEWVGFPDDDCWYEPDTLQQLSHRFADTEPLTGAVARWAECPESPHLPPHLTRERAYRFRNRLAISIMLFFNRRLFDHVGAFDTRLGVGQWFGSGEETDLVMRALAYGARIEVESRAAVHHPIKLPRSTALDRAAIRQRERGSGALYVKHKVPAQVIARGLVAPLLRSLGHPRGPDGLINAWFTVLGRWEGFIQWRRQQRSLFTEVAHSRTVLTDDI
jgi:glycosyltransferase involved in cell wall biosynthesis